MKILFVYRGYGDSSENCVVENQLNSLKDSEFEFSRFIINRGGIISYLISIWRLKHHIKTEKVDLLHAHYSFSGFISVLSCSKPVVCSLMGSDLYQQKPLVHLLTCFCYKFLWKATIVKSPQMKERIKIASIIPNGVDLSIFFEQPQQLSLRKTGFDFNKINIIFVAKNPEIKVKNLKLAIESIRLLDNQDILLNLLSGISISELKYYYSAADLLLLTSLSEGSPNVIKEAMACNCPIVSTDVGDVREVIGDTEGCYLTTFDPEDVAEKIGLALKFGKRTNGRERIGHLDNKIIAARIFEIYRKVTNA